MLQASAPPMIIIYGQDPLDTVSANLDVEPRAQADDWRGNHPGSNLR